LAVAVLVHLVVVFFQVPELGSEARCGGANADVSLCADTRISTETTLDYFGLVELPVYFAGFNVEYLHYVLFLAEFVAVLGVSTSFLRTGHITTE
jgi:hypothetical protein